MNDLVTVDDRKLRLFLVGFDRGYNCGDLYYLYYQRPCEKESKNNETVECNPRCVFYSAENMRLLLDGE